MDFLNKIDWQNHDGVNFPMLNDFMRNQFYDRILSRYVQNQSCTDIGFGTGLLTMLALKHGAKHVRAFESDWNRYQLGCEIIRRLGLQSQIELINEKYHHDCTPTPITFMIEVCSFGKSKCIIVFCFDNAGIFQRCCFE